MDGYGEFHWPDGRKYKNILFRYYGNFLNDKRHGEGEYILSNGKRFKVLVLNIGKF